MAEDDIMKERKESMAEKTNVDQRSEEKIVNGLEKKRSRFSYYMYIAMAVWVTVTGISLYWNLYQQKLETDKVAITWARASFDKDVLYRSWNAEHGGVYVPITDKTESNPYLSHLPERDITTPSGKNLTLINPAYMTRQVHDLAKEKMGVLGHITSLQPIRPLNVPDPWERLALQAFEQGEKEVSSIEVLDGKPYMRLMKPLKTEKGCLKCHGSQGYEEGEIRGGISASIPLEPLLVSAHKSVLFNWIGHGVLGVLGLSIICFGSIQLLRKTNALQENHEKLEKAKLSIESNERKLQYALGQISTLIQNTTSRKDRGIRFENPSLQKCYELKNCNNRDCCCYGKEAMRCWQKVGTYSTGEAKRLFEERNIRCSECNVFKKNTLDTVYEIGEQFNNMMHVLDGKNEELDNAYNELKDKQVTILQQEKMASIGQLAAGVAHEINNPIGFVTSNLGTLEKYSSNVKKFILDLNEITEQINENEVATRIKEKQVKFKIDYILEDINELIKESLDGAARVKNIVLNLKTFSRLDEMPYKEADINECIESTLNIISNELKYKSTLEKSYGKLPLTKCYAQQLNQVFVNLLINAVQSIEKHGEIKIKTWCEDSSIFVSISDTGCGIPKDKLNRIFEPFFTTKEVGNGIGLGLSIAYDIVKKHNGKITVDSEEGNGTIFLLELPVVV